MSNVKYFPLSKSKKLKPSEFIELRELQYFITGAQNGMNNRIKNMPMFWQVIERSLFHVQFTDKIRLVKNDS